MKSIKTRIIKLLEALNAIANFKGQHTGEFVADLMEIAQDAIQEDRAIQHAAKPEEGKD